MDKKASVLDEFRKADADGNETLDWEEFTRMCNNLGMTDHETASAFKAADTNGDGRIEFDELFEFIVGNNVEKHLKEEVISGFTKGAPKITDDPRFNALIALLIILNAVMLGVELSMDGDNELVEQISDNAFTLVWTIEMCLRIWFVGCRGYWKDTWNRFDGVLVWLAITDTWMLPLLLGYTPAGSWISMLLICRMLRVARVIRIVRLFRIFQEAWQLVGGLIKAMRALVWVVVLLLIILYSGSIFATTLIGHECGLSYEFNECSEFYGGLFSSAYSLFEAMTGDLAVVRPVVSTNPWMSLFFLFFVTLTNFGLLNIIMGEFVKTCERADVQSIFEDLELPVSRRTLALRLYEVLDVERTQALKIDDFVGRADTLRKEGARLLRDPTLLQMHLELLERRHTRTDEKLDRILKRLDFLSGAAIPGRAADVCEEPAAPGTLASEGVALDTARFSQAASSQVHMLQQLLANDAELKNSVQCSQREFDKATEQLHVVSQELKELCGGVARPQESLPAEGATQGTAGTETILTVERERVSYRGHPSVPGVEPAATLEPSSRARPVPPLELSSNSRSSGFACLLQRKRHRASIGVTIPPPSEPTVPPRIGEREGAAGTAPMHIR